MNKNATAMLVLSVLAGLNAFGQERKEPCTAIKYENRNQVDPKPFSMSLVSGQVVVTMGDVSGSMRDVGPVTEACVALFTEKDHQLVASANIDSVGRFMFDAVPEGKYRLLVRSDPLCVANVPVTIIKTKRGTQKRKQIVIHMRPAGIDTCSYAEYR
jgi:hypothetical protein